MNPFVCNVVLISACPVKGSNYTRQSSYTRGTDCCRLKKTVKKGNF